MDSEFKAFILLVGMFLAVCTVVAGCSVTNTASNNKAKVEMVKAGNDPMSVSCAFGDATPDLCKILAAKK